MSVVSTASLRIHAVDIVYRVLALVGGDRCCDVLVDHVYAVRGMTLNYIVLDDVVDDDAMHLYFRPAGLNPFNHVACDLAPPALVGWCQ